MELPSTIERKYAAEANRLRVALGPLLHDRRHRRGDVGRARPGAGQRERVVARQRAEPDRRGIVPDVGQGIELAARAHRDHEQE